LALPGSQRSLQSPGVVATGGEHEGLRERAVAGIERTGDAVVVSLAGELDLYNADEVREALFAVDLSRVVFIDSTALGVLIEARTKLPNSAGFLLAAPALETKRALEISGLDRHFTLHETRESALGAPL
jgi:anti-sigma B factor antagonist